MTLGRGESGAPYLVSQLQLFYYNVRLLGG